MQTISTTCDNCQADLSVSDKPRTCYSLAQQWMPVSRLSHVERWEPTVDLNPEKHFCDLRCLNNWAVKLKGVSETIHERVVI